MDSWKGSCVKSLQMCLCHGFQQPRLRVTCQTGKPENSRCKAEPLSTAVLRHFWRGKQRSELHFTLSFTWSSEDRFYLTELYRRGTLSQMLHLTLSCASWPLGNVSSGWTDILGYNVITLASIHYNYREGGGIVRSGSLASYSTKHWNEYVIKTDSKTNAGKKAWLDTECLLLTAHSCVSFQHNICSWW